jgi:hypothetical protein
MCLIFLVVLFVVVEDGEEDYVNEFLLETKNIPFVFFVVVRLPPVVLEIVFAFIERFTRFLPAPPRRLHDGLDALFPYHHSFLDPRECMMRENNIFASTHIFIFYEIHFFL